MVGQEVALKLVLRFGVFEARFFEAYPVHSGGFFFCSHFQQSYLYDY